MGPQTRVLAAIAVRGFAASSGGVMRQLELLSRIHGMFSAHVSAHNGVLCPTGTDLGMASFLALADALCAVFAFRSEFDAARAPSSHAHGSMVGAGICGGEVVLLPDGRALGPVSAQVLRLAIVAERRGDVLLRECSDGLPDGFGAHAAPANLTQQLGFSALSVADYRD